MSKNLNTTLDLSNSRQKFHIQNFMHELADGEIEIDYNSSGLMLDY